MKVINVWSGCYVGGGNYEGADWGYDTIDGEYHNIEYTVSDTDFDSLIDGLILEVKKLRRKKTITPESKERDLDLGIVGCIERWVFYFDDGTKIIF